MSQTIRVFVADDIDQVRSALKDTLAKTQDIEVVGEASDGHGVVCTSPRKGANLDSSRDRHKKIMLTVLLGTARVRRKKLKSLVCLD